jgi:hypothetical protein
MMADQQRHLWFCECRSHLAGFAAARFDDPCAVADAARGWLMALAPVMPCPAFRTAPATGLRFGQSLRRNSASRLVLECFAQKRKPVLVTEFFQQAIIIAVLPQRFDKSRQACNITKYAGNLGTVKI